MAEDEKTTLERFIKVFSGLPLEERSQTIAVIDEQPINWNLAYQHIKNNTELGKKIGEKLKELEII
ncbi:MAG: hypothetical protein KJ906_02455 [Nanoarchaeota archaeon]|nr:hypothetical protein [Nanoarchaeota archaeon]